MLTRMPLVFEDDAELRSAERAWKQDRNDPAAKARWLATLKRSQSPDQVKADRKARKDRSAAEKVTQAAARERVAAADRARRAAEARAKTKNPPSRDTGAHGDYGRYRAPRSPADQAKYDTARLGRRLRSALERSRKPKA